MNDRTSLRAVAGLAAAGYRGEVAPVGVLPTFARVARNAGRGAVDRLRPAAGDQPVRVQAGSEALEAYLTAVEAGAAR